MIFGMSIATFTQLHVVISLVAMVAGLAVVVDFLRGRWRSAWTALFLLTTIATSVTGFMFPFTTFGPPHVVGLLSLVILAVALYALYGAQLRGPWRWLYVTTAMAALYLNVFVGVVQAFEKFPALRALAPTQTEPAFIVAQLAVLALSIVLTVLALRRFHPETESRIGAGA